MEHKLTRAQRDFLYLMLKVQEQNIFNNGYKAGIHTILKYGTYDNHEKKLLQRVRLHWLWFLSERKKGNNPGPQSHYNKTKYYRELDAQIKKTTT